MFGATSVRNTNRRRRKSYSINKLKKPIQYSKDNVQIPKTNTSPLQDLETSSIPLLRRHNSDGNLQQLYQNLQTNPSTLPTTTFTLSDFFYKEIFGVHDVKSTDGVHQERVQNFLSVPYQIEQLFFFGVLLALDSFLYILTYLPMRIIFACLCAITSSVHTRVFHRTHVYDFMVAILILVGTIVLCHVDMSRVYHAIRGQALIKLYVLFTMIEIFDRLFSSLGQDVLDSLYYTIKYQPHRTSRLIIDFAVALVYVVLHALLLYAQVVTINVAINSSNTSLLTLLISNNFAELKSCVFKKFEEQNLFQISCSDIVERFKLVLILSLILIQSHTPEIVYGTGMVLCAEMIIDWIKHAFITKFNGLPPTVYNKFCTVLCRDLTGWNNHNMMLDHAHHVSRRLGLVSIPLTCIVSRTLIKNVADSPIQFTSPIGCLMTLMVFLCLAAIKCFLSLSLMSYAIASGRVEEYTVSYDTDVKDQVHPLPKDIHEKTR